MVCVTLHKIAYGREDREATLQFIEEVQNFLDLWHVSSVAYNDMKKRQKMEELAEKLWSNYRVLRFDASLTCERTSLSTF